MICFLGAGYCPGFFNAQIAHEPLSDGSPAPRRNAMGKGPEFFKVTESMSTFRRGGMRHVAPRRSPRRGSHWQLPTMKNGRWRMHGGPPPGAPKVNKNALKHGRYTAQAMERRREIAALLRAMRALAGSH
jgi:hypothetical protein